jgi:hypothetical protein
VNSVFNVSRQNNYFVKYQTDLKLSFLLNFLGFFLVKCFISIRQIQTRLIDMLLTQHVIHSSGGQSLRHRELLAQWKLLPHFLVLPDCHSLLHRINVWIVADARIRPIILLLMLVILSLLLLFRLGNRRIVKRLPSVRVRFFTATIRLIFSGSCVNRALRR